MLKDISIESLVELFQQFEGKRVLVIGDVMLDSYWWGKVERISPEAPVPIVQISKKEFRLGGAANVALNLKTLGADPVICSVLGEDQEADIFLAEAKHKKISTEGIIRIKDRPTTVKTRVIGNKSQLLRIDHEDDREISLEDSDRLFDKIMLEMHHASLIIFEDYDKGVLSKEMIQDIIFQAKARKIPVAVDPKKRNFHSYAGATLFKPNLRELSEGLKIEITSASSMEDIRDASADLIRDMDLHYAMITLSERGVYISNKIDGLIIPAHVRHIADVSGAGDTVISVAALALLCGAHMDLIAALANLAGGLVCEKAGVVPIEKDELLKEAVKEFVR